LVIKKRVGSRSFCGKLLKCRPVRPGEKPLGEEGLSGRRGNRSVERSGTDHFSLSKKIRLRTKEKGGRRGVEKKLSGLKGKKTEMIGPDPEDGEKKRREQSEGSRGVQEANIGKARHSVALYLQRKPEGIGGGRNLPRGGYQDDGGPTRKLPFLKRSVGQKKRLGAIKYRAGRKSALWNRPGRRLEKKNNKGEGGKEDMTHKTLIKPPPEHGLYRRTRRQIGREG